MIADLFGGKTKADPQRVAKLKDWVAQALALNADASVMVAELRCTEPGCPPLETVIAILDSSAPSRQFKVHKALSDIVPADVARLATSAGQTCHKENCS